MSKKVLLSGIQSSGRSHIGNYIGAMKQFVDYQDEYNSYIFVANFHSLTTVKDADQLRQDTNNLILDYLAVGLDPKKVTLYRQTDVPEVTELAWYFNTLVTMPYLMRAHAFKDAGSKSKEINIGLFDYPVLQAADILIMEPDIVPVGQDQKQHIEMARDIAEKFNNTWGETFKLPEPVIKEEVAVVPGIDGKKMSKSRNTGIPLFGTDEEIKKAVMSIVTNSVPMGEAIEVNGDNVFALHKLFSKDDLSNLQERYLSGTIGHKESKEILAENIIKLVKPMRERREELERDPDYVEKVLQEGAKKAKEKASKKMEQVRKAVGVI